MRTIALLGSPGSGKTRLAKALRDEIVRYDGSDGSCKTPVAIVDGYAEFVRDESWYEIGLDGGYMANISIANERYNLERAATNEHAKTLITCGTVIETSVYTSMQFERAFKVLASDEDKIQAAQRLEGCVKMLAVLYMDTFKYDQAFYLPPLNPHKDERWATFERNLQAAFAAYAAPVVPLLIETHKDENDLVRQQVERVLDRKAVAA